MTSPEDKARWKQEAETLKKDLKNRPKDVIKREVPIRLRDKKESPPSSISAPVSDDWTRKQLGL
jgi:hypothetical protein